MRTMRRGSYLDIVVVNGGCHIMRNFEICATHLLLLGSQIIDFMMCWTHRFDTKQGMQTKYGVNLLENWKMGE
jgi:hypothetical protein